jgi:hypothetical protein
VNIGELFIELGFKADTMKLQDFTRALMSLNMSSVMSVLGLGAMYEATAKIMNIADQASMNLWGFNQVTGISVKQATQFSDVVEQLGGSAQDAQSSLKGLQTAMFNVLIGRGNMEPFVLTGISPSEKNIFKVLEQLGKFLRESPAEDSVKRMIVAEMGLSESMIPVLKNTKDINAAMEKQGYISQSQIEGMTKFHKANASLGQSLKLIWVDIAVLIGPTLERMAKFAALYTSGMDNLLGKKKGVSDIHREFLGGFGEWITPMLEYNKSVYGGALQKVGSSAASYTTHQKVDIHVNGAQNPDLIADTINKKIDKMLSDTYYHQEPQKR